MRKAALAVAVLILAAGSCFAGTLVSMDVRIGNWDAGSSTFTNDLEWNSYIDGNWAVGATAPGYGNTLLNGFQSVSLPDGEYWLYMGEAWDQPDNAIQITLGYLGGGSNVEVFTVPSSTSPYVTPESTFGYTLVSGSGFTAGLVTVPQSNYLLVGQGQAYSPDGTPNWIMDLNSAPEPGSRVLMGTGFAALVFFSRRRRNALRA